MSYTHYTHRRGTLKLYNIKYLYIPLLAKIFGEEILCKKNSSLASQNVEEINISGKQS